MTVTDFTALPFVQARDGKATCLWSVRSSDDYAADCETGRGYADVLIGYVRSAADPAIMPLIAGAIGGRRTGIEAGFWTRLAEGVN